MDAHIMTTKEMRTMDRRSFLRKGLGAVGMMLVPGAGIRVLKDKLAVSKKALSEALKDSAGWKRLANSWFVHVSDLQDERIDLLKGLEEQDKEIETWRIKNAISKVCSDLLDSHNVGLKKEIEDLENSRDFWQDYTNRIHDWWMQRHAWWHERWAGRDREIETLEKENAILDSDWRFWHKIVDQERDHNQWLQKQLDLETKMADIMHERWATAERDKAKLKEENMVLFEKYAVHLLRSSPPLRGFWPIEAENDLEEIPRSN